MNIATRIRLLKIVVLLSVLTGTGCDRSEPPSQPNTSVVSRTQVAPAPMPFANATVRAPDAFYDPPANISNKPGALLRSEPLKEATLPAGMQGWRILYTTTIDDRTSAIAIATVFAPMNLPAGPRPVIAWAHGTTGLVQRCMPSLVSTPAETIPAPDRIVAKGWVVVATDYSFAEKEGPHPYLIGEGEARSVLDSVRAVRQLSELKLDERTVVWGASQGGHSALWTGIVGPRYAPDIKLTGVVAIAPVADIKHLFAINSPIDRRLGPYLAQSYSRFYADVKFENAVRPGALAAAREMAKLCGLFPPEDPVRVRALMTSFDGPALAMDTNAALAERLAQNAADRAIAAPVLIAQGLADSVVPPLATTTYVDERCAAGQRLEYWTFAEKDHGGIVQPGSPLEAPLIAWTTARFANEPQTGGCARKAF